MKISVLLSIRLNSCIAVSRHRGCTNCSPWSSGSDHIPDSLHAGNLTDRSGILRMDALPPSCVFSLFASFSFLSFSCFIFLNWIDRKPPPPPHNPPPHHPKPTDVDEPSAVCERVSFPSLLCDRLWQVGGWWSDGDVRRPRPLWCWVAVALEAPSAKKKRSVARGRFSWTVSASQLPSAHPPTHPHTLTHTHPQSHTLHAHAFIVSLKMLMDAFVNWADFIGSVLQTIHQVFCYNSRLLDMFWNCFFCFCTSSWPQCHFFNCYLSSTWMMDI